MPTSETPEFQHTSVRRRFIFHIPIFRRHRFIRHYYYDHQPELDARIEEGGRKAELLRNQAGESPVRKRLRDMDRLV